jgi:hypothetical protein
VDARGTDERALRVGAAPIRRAWWRFIGEAGGFDIGAKSADEILGAEYDWLACDGDGHAALFSTAGGGYAPDEFLQDTDAHTAAIKAVLACQATTSARFAPALAPECENTWKLVAERGLFAFDADVNGGAYRLVAAPDVAINAAHLPEVAVDAMRSLTFPRLRFSNLTTLSEQALQQGRWVVAHNGQPVAVGVNGVSVPCLTTTASARSSSGRSSAYSSATTHTG